MPLDQFPAYILGLFEKKKRTAFFALLRFWGNEDDLKGTKDVKLFLGAIFTIKLGKHEFFCQNVGSKTVYIYI